MEYSNGLPKSGKQLTKIANDLKEGIRSSKAIENSFHDSQFNAELKKYRAGLREKLSVVHDHMREWNAALLESKSTDDKFHSPANATQDSATDSAPTAPINEKAGTAQDEKVTPPAADQPISENVIFWSPDTSTWDCAAALAAEDAAVNVTEEATSMENEPYSAWSKLVPGKGEALSSQSISCNMYPDTLIIKKLLNGLEKLKSEETQGVSNADKREILCGTSKILSKYDIFEGLTDDEVNTFNRNLTPSQIRFLFRCCRYIMNSIAILEGPPGSGKTTIIKKLVQIAHKRGLKVVIVADSDIAADNVVEKITDDAYVCVRVHPTGLENLRSLRSSREDVDDSKLAQEENQNDNGPPAPAMDIPEMSDDDWENDEMEMAFMHDDYMFKSYQDRLANLNSTTRPGDPRRKLVTHSSWIWILRVLKIVEFDVESSEVKGITERLAAKTEFKEFRELYQISQVRHLSRTQCSKYVNLVNECLAVLIKEGTHATVCTISQLIMDWANDISFDWAIIDEANTMTEAQLVSVWRDSKLLVWIGDLQQLGIKVFSTVKNNPFVHQLRLSPFERFIRNGYPYTSLCEVMRMPKGLETLHSDLFYESRLKPGEGTELTHTSREIARRTMEIVRSRWPSLRSEPAGFMFPVFIDMKSKSLSGKDGGQPRVNLCNIAATIELIIWGVESDVVSPAQIGIATPYYAQVSKYNDILAEMENDKPGQDWKSVRVGTEEWWQGKQAPWIIVDLVCASNDHASVELVADRKLLNVLISRCEEALFIVGDTSCIIATGNKRKSRPLQALFDWVQGKGRVIEIPVTSLSTQYVQIPTSTMALATSPDGLNSTARNRYGSWTFDPAEAGVKWGK